MSQTLRDRARFGAIDLEAVEMAMRRCMHEIGGRLLEELVNADGGDYRGPRIDCGRGHQAEFVEYRSKGVTTVLASIQIQRAYYHCSACHVGVVPKDQALDIVATTCSPGVRRLMARVGGQGPFERGRCDLEELAGIRVQTKQVERVAEAVGQQVRTVVEAEAEAAWAGKLVGLSQTPRMYIAMDGTGVPIVAWELVDREAKDPSTGPAKTREAKLGCVFTQARRDEKGRPIRDAHSTTYVGAIEPAQQFGRRLYTEAVRRGLLGTKEVVVLGDGAAWIWNLTQEHFPEAIEILDLYHAREHVSDLAKAVYGTGTRLMKSWCAERYKELDAGRVEDLLQSLQQLPVDSEELGEQVRKAIAYFGTNAERMRYGRFRRQSLFIGSGVVEAGCKTVIGQRLKQSGMRWTVAGANQILALRCCQLSGRWEDFWERRRVA